MENTMRKIFLVAAGALALLAGQAKAEPASNAPPAITDAAGAQCMEWPVALTATQTSNPDASMLKLMDGQMAQDFINIVNQLPPESHFDGSQVALFFKPSEEHFLVLIGKKECASYVVELPPDGGPGGLIGEAPSSDRARTFGSTSSGTPGLGSDGMHGLAGTAEQDFEFGIRVAR
jgi:hypothetical protein